ncbi:unnamed protein product, partial [Strongylus vulgaris]
FTRSAINPSWLNIVTQCTFNNPEYHTLEQAAALGIGNARSLATLFNLFINGRIVSEKTLSLIMKPVINETDYVIQMPTVKGHGFFYHKPMADGRIFFFEKIRYKLLNVGLLQKLPLIGHSGHGCQQIIFDMERKIVIAYVTNGVKMGMYNKCRNYARLHKAVYDVIERS